MRKIFTKGGFTYLFAPPTELPPASKLRELAQKLAAQNIAQGESSAKLIHAVFNAQSSSTVKYFKDSSTGPVSALAISTLTVETIKPAAATSTLSSVSDVKAIVSRRRGVQSSIASSSSLGARSSRTSMLRLGLSSVSLLNVSKTARTRPIRQSLSAQSTLYALFNHVFGLAQPIDYGRRYFTQGYFGLADNDQPLKDAFIAIQTVKSSLIVSGLNRVTFISAGLTSTSSVSSVGLNGIKFVNGNLISTGTSTSRVIGIVRYVFGNIASASSITATVTSFVPPANSADDGYNYFAQSYFGMFNTSGASTTTPVAANSNYDYSQTTDTGSGYFLQRY